MATKLLNIHQVVERTSQSRPTVYRLIAKKAFPAPVKIGLRRVGWVEAEIEAHIASLIGERDRKAA